MLPPLKTTYDVEIPTTAHRCSGILVFNLKLASFKLGSHQRSEKLDFNCFRREFNTTRPDHPSMPSTTPEHIKKLSSFQLVLPISLVLNIPLLTISYVNPTRPPSSVLTCRAHHDKDSFFSSKLIYIPVRSPQSSVTCTHTRNNHVYPNSFHHRESPSHASTNFTL